MDDLLHAQLDHNTWATRRLIEACRGLEGDAFTQPFDIGPGSLQQTLMHIIEAMFFFADALRGVKYEPRADLTERAAAPDGLLHLLDRADRELRDAVFAYLDEHFTRDCIPWPGGDRQYPAAVVLAQIFDHGTHHRAQVLHMLRRSGLNDLPETWPLKWVEDQSATG